MKTETQPTTEEEPTTGEEQSAEEKPIEEPVQGKEENLGTETKKAEGAVALEVVPYELARRACNKVFYDLVCARDLAHAVTDGLRGEDTGLESRVDGSLTALCAHLDQITYAADMAFGEMYAAKHSVEAEVAGL